MKYNYVIGRISQLFDAIPAQLNKHAAKYQISGVLKNQRTDDTILNLVSELKDSKTVLAAYHTNDPNAGMTNSKDLSKFKLYLADTGLFTTLAFKDKDFTEKFSDRILQRYLIYTKDLRKKKISYVFLSIWLLFYRSHIGL